MSTLTESPAAAIVTAAALADRLYDAAFANPTDETIARAEQAIADLEAVALGYRNDLWYLAE